MKFVLKTDFTGDFGNRKISCEQKVSGLIHSLLLQVFHGGHAERLGKKGVKTGGRKANHFCQVFKRESLGGVLLYGAENRRQPLENIYKQKRILAERGTAGND